MSPATDSAVRELREAAIRYVDEGVPILRVHYVKDGGCSCTEGKTCAKAAKHPVGRKWQDAATTDVATINSWWKDKPWNIGTIVREEGSMTVLDVEGPTGHPIDGRATFKRLAADLDMDSYPRSQTPSGGFHLWGRAPEEIDKLLDPAPGIEVFGERARFKMVILPPSATPTGRYDWVTEGFEPEELTDLRPFPPQLWDDAAATNGQAPQSTAMPATTPAVPMARHGFMLKVAGAMRRHRATESEILAALRTMKAERGWDDKPDDELERIARDIGAKPDGATTATLSRVADLAKQLEKAVAEGNPGKARSVATDIAREVPASAFQTAMTWRPIAQALAEPDPPLSPLWPGIVFCGAFSLFAAAPKAGKTWLLLAWVASLVRQGGWLGAGPIRRQVRVLLVTEEPLFIVKSQARLFGIEENVDVLTLDCITPGISWPALVEAAAERAVETGAELMLFDTISTLAGMEDENSASDVNAALRPLLLAARRYDLAVVGVHHAGTSGRIRGSTVFEAVPDVLVEVGLVGNASRRRGLRVRSRLEGAPEGPVTVEWMPREGDIPARYRLAGSERDTAGEAELRSTLELDNRIVHEVEQAVAEGGDWITAARVVERIGSAAGRIRGRLASLVLHERLARERGTGQGSAYLYGPPEAVPPSEPVPNLSAEACPPVPTCPSPVPCGPEAGSPNLSNLPRGAVSPREGTGAYSRTGIPRALGGSASEDRDTAGRRPDGSRIRRPSTEAPREDRAPLLPWETAS